MSLVGLLVAMAVSAIVACIVIDALARTTLAVQAHQRRMETRDAAWLALDAMANDMGSGSDWRVCQEARECPRYRRRAAYRSRVLLTPGADWLVTHGLHRCAGQCAVYLDQVSSMTLLADVEAADGTITRLPYHPWHGVAPRVVEVQLVMQDGQRYSRVVRRRPDAGDDRSR